MTLAKPSLIDRVNGFARKVPIWLVYIVYLLPAPWLFYLALTGGMGIEPIKPLEHELGEIAMQLLIIGLCITPLRKYLGLNLLRFRRAIGVVAFIYVALHLGVWVILDMSLLWGQMWADILKRPYITIGMGAFVMLLPLAATSNNLSLRRLGARTWRKLHKLVYPAAILGAVHFIMVQKTWEVEPMVYLAILLVLVGLRYSRAKSPA